MAHQSSSESDNQITPQPQPLELKEPHQPKDNNNNIMDQEQEHSDKVDTLGPTPSTSKAHACDNMKTALKELVLPPATQASFEPDQAMAEDSGRERLKRHRVSVAGRVWIPDIWGQEDLLKDWIDCTAFDAPLVSSRIMMARAALVQEGRRARSGGLRIESRS